MISIDAMQRLMSDELSLRSRLGYTTLLLMAGGVTTGLLSLWLTEPVLPARTQIAFGLMTVIGLSWTAFALWVLTRRRVLLARHRIIATGLSVAFTALFVAGAVAIGSFPGEAPAAYTAAGLGLVLFGVAVTLHIHARREFSRLMSERQRLEGRLGDTARAGAGR